MATTADINWALFKIKSITTLNAPYPLFDVVGNGAIGVSATADIDFPLFYVTGESKNAKLDTNFPLFSVSSTGDTGGVSRLNKKFGLFALTASGGRASHASIPFPLFTIDSISGTPTEATAFLPWGLFTVEAQAVIEAFIADEVATWLLNVESGHHSTYTNWNANSHGIFNGQEIAAMDGGIFSLSGEDDEGEEVIAKLYWPPSDLGDSSQKAIDLVYIRMRGETDAVKLVAVIDETEKRFFIEDMSMTSDGNCVKRVKIPKGLQGNLWQFGIESVGFSNLDFFEIEVVSLPLKRRVK